MPSIESNRNYGGDQTATWAWPSRAMPTDRECNNTVYLSEAAHVAIQQNYDLWSDMAQMPRYKNDEYMKWPLTEHNGPRGSWEETKRVDEPTRLAVPGEPLP
jgi:hypothetical protein